jgi:hypothetical protein
MQESQAVSFRTLRTNEITSQQETTSFIKQFLHSEICITWIRNN